jgi:hypothetical protein
MIAKETIMDGYKLVNSNKNYPFRTDGKKVYFLVHEIKNADLDSFIIYDEDIPWAKDKKTVYCQSSEAVPKLQFLEAKLRLASFP